MRLEHLPPDFQEGRKHANKFKAWFFDNWFKYIGVPLITRVEGIWWIVYDEFVSVEIAIGSHEPDEIKFLQSHIKDGMMIFDIGAHNGFNSALFSKLSPNGMIYAFEPSPREYKGLKRTLRLNKCGNVFIKHVALSYSFGEKDFALSVDDNTGYSSLHERHNQDLENAYIKIQKVMCHTLDDCTHLYGVDFLKIDVEGHEISVFKGGMNFLNTYKPDILYEDWTVYNQRLNSCQSYQLLKEFDYKLYERMEGGIAYPLKDNDFVTKNNIFASRRL